MMQHYIISKGRFRGASARGKLNGISELNPKVTNLKKLTLRSLFLFVLVNTASALILFENTSYVFFLKTPDQVEFWSQFKGSVSKTRIRKYCIYFPGICNNHSESAFKKPKNEFSVDGTQNILTVSPAED